MAVQVQMVRTVVPLTQILIVFFSFVIETVALDKPGGLQPVEIAVNCRLVYRKAVITHFYQKVRG